jgi:hypothetical protein
VGAGNYAHYGYAPDDYVDTSAGDRKATRAARS